MIREATNSDLDTLVTLEKELFQDDAWSKEEFLHEMNDNPCAYLYVYEEDDQVLGYIIPWFAYENADIANIGVKTSAQKRGIASQLMQYFLTIAKEKGCTKYSLEVRVSNDPAINLYKKHGYKIVSVRKNYYSDHEDAYLMVKE